MKKFLGIVVLGLLWCNVGFAKIKQLIAREENRKAFFSEYELPPTTKPEAKSFLSAAYVRRDLFN